LPGLIVFSLRARRALPRGLLRHVVLLETGRAVPRRAGSRTFGGIDRYMVADELSDHCGPAQEPLHLAGLSGSLRRRAGWTSCASNSLTATAGWRLSCPTTPRSWSRHRNRPRRIRVR